MLSACAGGCDRAELFFFGQPYATRRVTLHVSSSSIRHRRRGQPLGIFVQNRMLRVGEWLCMTHTVLPLRSESRYAHSVRSSRRLSRKEPRLVRGPVDVGGGMIQGWAALGGCFRAAANGSGGSPKGGARAESPRTHRGQFCPLSRVWDKGIYHRQPSHADRSAGNACCRAATYTTNLSHLRAYSCWLRLPTLSLGYKHRPPQAAS